MKTKYLIYVFLINLIFSCEGDNREIMEEWGNSNPKKVRVNDKTYSFETNYYEGGKKESEGIIVEEKKEKDWIYYYSNGKVKQKIIYREGKPFEEAIYFYENGSAKIEGEYDETGLKNSFWTTYSPSGKIESKGEYSQGRKIGKWSYFNSEGSLEKEEQLDNLGGYVYESNYNEKGDLVRYSEYYNLNGVKFEIYKIDSTTNKMSFRSYFKNGQVEAEGVKLNSHEVGLWTYWYPDGQKKAQGIFNENTNSIKQNDIIKINYKIRSKLPLQRILSGIMIGKWEYWNTEGKKVAVIESKLENHKIVEKIVYVNKGLLE